MLLVQFLIKPIRNYLATELAPVVVTDTKVSGHLQEVGLCLNKGVEMHTVGVRAEQKQFLP